jgi:hypothetical protein
MPDTFTPTEVNEYLLMGIKGKHDYGGKQYTCDMCGKIYDRDGIYLWYGWAACVSGCLNRLVTEERLSRAKRSGRMHF